MNKITNFAVLLALASINTGLHAQDKPGMKHSMQGSMQMSPEQMDNHMRAMQEHMLTMHDYSDRILAEQDPEKKEKLKNEQLELMKAHHKQMMQHRQKMMNMHKKMTP